jgi:hypothetical protein
VTTEALSRPRPAGVDWHRAEFVLTLLAFLGFLTLPIRITTIYSGLPAHPLFIHVPVIMIPLSVIGALACIVRPAWFERYGILLCLAAIVAMSSTFLAMFTAVLILTFAAHRIAGGSPTGLGIADRILGTSSTLMAMRVALVVLALVSAFMVFRVGDLGAKAVWSGRLQHSGAGPGGGPGFPGGGPPAS